MGFFDWLLGKRKNDHDEPETLGEHAVIIFIRLSDEDFGQEEERENIFRLEKSLIAAIQEAQAGEYDSNEFGGGHAVLTMFGHDADVLFDVVMQHIEGINFKSDSYVIKRYGLEADPDVKEVRVDLSQ